MYASSIVFAIVATGALASPALVKREVACGLTNFPAITLGPLQEARDFLNRGPSDPVSASNGCNLITCSFGTGVSLCTEESISINKGRVLTDLNEAADECGVPDQGGDNQFPAFQNFKDGYNILITGGFSC